MQHRAYKHYLLTVLTIIVLFNYVDRFALGIVLQDIKADLSLSDTQLGVLSGIAFALFYSVMGIPIARWADRGNRVTIISLTAALWSAAVDACAFALAPMVVSAWAGVIDGNRGLGKALAAVCMIASVLCTATFAWGRRGASRASVSESSGIAVVAGPG